MSSADAVRPIQILMVEDSLDDIDITMEALKDAKVSNNLAAVRDGVEAMAYLRRQGEFHDASRPDVILLDLNLPRKDGRQVLEQIKSDPDLQKIPVVVLTTRRRTKTSCGPMNCTPTATSPSPSTWSSSSR